MAVAYKDLLDPAHLTRIENYALMAKAAVEGFLSGMHRSVFHGFGTEFCNTAITFRAKTLNISIGRSMPNATSW